MCCKGFAKRILPFFLTFAVGLFIASFFVSIAVPRFQFPNRGSKRRHIELDRQRDLELQTLRDENFRLKNQLPDRDAENADYQNLIYASPASPTLKSVPRQGK